MAYRIAAVALLTLLTGCQQGVAVRVDQDAAGVTFTLVPSGGGAACLGTLTLYPGEPENAKPLWYISNGKASQPCVTTLRYGDSPPGFGRSPAAPPLVSGRSYRVAVSGNAFVGSTRFERR